MSERAVMFMQVVDSGDSDTPADLNRVAKRVIFVGADGSPVSPGGGGVDAPAMTTADISAGTSEVPMLVSPKLLTGQLNDLIVAALAPIISRVEVLEGKASTTEGKLSTAEGKIATLESGATTTNGKVSTLEGSVSTLGDRVSALESA